MDTLRKLRHESPRARARQKLMRHIEGLNRQGMERLPSEKRLCEILDISRITLRNAVQELERENHLEIRPRKGMFIRSHAPIKYRIGIIHGNGAEASYHLHSAQLLTTMLESLTQAEALVKIISACNLRNRFDALFSKYDLDGLIWLQPEKSMLDAIRRMPEKVVSAIIRDIGPSPLSGNYVSLDYQHSGRMRAEYFMRRGHGRIAYIGNLGQTFDSFTAALAEAGIRFNPNCLIANESDIPKRLPALLRDGNVTAIVSDGGESRLEKVFMALEAFPRRDEIELLISRIHTLHDLMARYPGVRVAAIHSRPFHEIGGAAARTMIQAVSGNKVMPPVLVRTTLTQVSGSPLSRNK